LKHSVVAVSKGCGHKTLLQQNLPVLNRGCQLTQIVLCNNRKMVVALVAAVVL